MQIKDVPFGSRVRVNLGKSHYFDCDNQKVDPNLPYIDGVLVGHNHNSTGCSFIAWREGEETTSIACTHLENDFVLGAYITPDTACVLAP